MAQQRYRVIERIDAGGMAEVFKANATSMQGFEKLVAIKRILPSLTQNERFVRMFLDEAKVSLHLNHTNCVQVFDLGIADGTYFIVMEYVNGTNLKKLIEHLQKQDERLAIEQAVFVALEVCKGLTHAHEKKDQLGKPLDIVHRDISPPNVLLSRAGEVKITDFGLAKAKSQAEITDPGVVKGKFGYLSPEAAQGEEVDERTDIFAVGILLWEMLAGRRLFLGKSDFDTLELVRDTRIPSVRKIRPEVPQALEVLLARALTRSPKDRYQSAKELATALATFLFQYGRVVTSYDLATRVGEILDRRPQRAKTAKDLAVDAAIQEQLNQLKSLEEIDDLDTYLAQHYDSLPDAGETREESNGNFEDPRMWADLGLGDGGPVTTEGIPASSMNQPRSASDSNTWEETGLADLAHSTSAYKAVIRPPVEGDSAVKAPPAGPPPVKAPPPDPVPRTSIHLEETQNINTPAVTPRKERFRTPLSTSKPQGLHPMVFTLLVALVVVAIGVGLGFALGLF